MDPPEVDVLGKWGFITGNGFSITPVSVCCQGHGVHKNERGGSCSRAAVGRMLLRSRRAERRGNTCVDPGGYGCGPPNQDSVYMGRPRRSWCTGADKRCGRGPHES